jgi:hypothetical protein
VIVLAASLPGAAAPVVAWFRGIGLAKRREAPLTKRVVHA